MTGFLTGQELHKAVSDLLKQPKARCAVAFWGSGAEKLLPGADARIICNLSAGGTNPFALRKLKTSHIKQCDLLHAKVYIGKSEAIVTSANASANGLGLEGPEQTSWIEAGVRVQNIKQIDQWFEDLWTASRDIQPNDWKTAEEAWRRRRQAKPTLSSFSDFDTTASELPLLSWIGDADWEYCPESVKQQLGEFNEAIERRIDDGLEIEHPSDEPVMKRRWVLCYPIGKAGKPVKNRKPWWVSLSDIKITDAFRYDGEAAATDVILSAEDPPPIPFDPGERRFLTTFHEVISRPDYARLRELDYEGSWFAERAELMAQFWRDLKTCYTAAAPSGLGK